MAEILRSGAGNRSGISDLVFGLPHGDGQCVCAAVPGAGVDELFKNGENRGTKPRKVLMDKEEFEAYINSAGS